MPEHELQGTFPYILLRDCVCDPLRFRHLRHYLPPKRENVRNFLFRRVSFKAPFRSPFGRQPVFLRVKPLDPRLHFTGKGHNIAIFDGNPTQGFEVFTPRQIPYTR